MSEPRTCNQCGKHLITHRADARFCDERCRARWNNKHRVKQSSTPIRIADADGGAGSRGGNVRSVAEARELQEQQKGKARWTLIVREHIARTLLSTGFLHADDLYELGVPPAQDAIKGSQTAAFVCRGWMTKAGERKCSHKAANGRKAKIYRLTEKGRKELRTLVGAEGERHRPSDVAVDDPGGSLCSGEKTGSGVPGPAGPGGVTSAPSPAPAAVGSSGVSPASSTPEEPARLPTFDESASARRIRDAA